MKYQYAIFAAVLTATPAFADDDPAADLQKADKALNETFNHVEARFAHDVNGKARLVHAQRAWIAFRDAECAFQSSGDDGGSAAPMIIAACRTTLSDERTKQLKTYLNCEEGDLSCPVPAN